MMRTTAGVEILEDGVWERLLRLRPQTSDDIGPVLDLDPESADRLVALMAAAGWIGPDRTIRYEWPVSAVVGGVQERLRNAEALLQRTIAEARVQLGTLPNLTRAWQLGEPAGQHLQLAVVTGLEAARRAWDTFGGRGLAPHIAVCAPPFSRLLDLDIAAEVEEFIARTGGSLRFLMSSADVEDAYVRERLLRGAESGAELRHHPTLPSWFWVNDGGEVAIPGSWGDMNPDTVVLFNHQGVADAMRNLYERLWVEAAPLERSARDWDALLRLLYAGSQIEAASRALGLSVRTGRRRISDAMDYYGVSNLFSLGAAWAEDNRRGTRFR